MIIQTPRTNRPEDWQHIVSWPGLRMPAKVWIAYCITFLVAFIGVDYFSSKKLNISISSEKFNQYFSRMYPHCIKSKWSCIWNFSSNSDASSQNQQTGRSVSVILWSDSGIERNEELVWPLHMETHADALDAILRYEPMAVFVDILFVDDPAKRGDESIEDLIDIIEKYEAEEVPIFFGDSHVDTIQVIEPLRNALGEGELIPVTLTANHTQITYPAKVDAGPDKERTNNGAVAIYEHVKKEILEKEILDINDFHIFWGGNSSEITRKGWDCHRLEMPGSFHEILLQALREIMPLSGSDPGSSELDAKTGSIACPYIPTLPADLFVEIPVCLPLPSNSDFFDFSDSSECRRYTSDYLANNYPSLEIDDVLGTVKDKYIVYGASFQAVSDIHRVPIYDHQGLPGVFVHAMALDNLVEMEGKVHSASTAHARDWWPDRILYYLISVPLSVLSFAISGYLIFSLWHSLERKAHRPMENLAARIVRWRSSGQIGAREVFMLKSIKLISLMAEILFHGVVIVSIGGLVLFITWLAFLYLRIGVINWLAILLSSGVLSIWTKTPFAEGLVDILLRRPSSGHH